MRRRNAVSWTSAPTSWRATVACSACWRGRSTSHSEPRDRASPRSYFAPDGRLRWRASRRAGARAGSTVHIVRSPVQLRRRAPFLGFPHAHSAHSPEIRDTHEGAPAVSRGDRRVGEAMKRIMILTLMLLAVLVLLSGVAHADLKSDEAIVQAP